jgi:hypothetical protein
VPTGAHGEGPKRRLDINAEGLQNSVHGKLNCLNCHADIEQIPHKKDGLQAVDCVDCHLTSLALRYWALVYVDWY